MTTITLYRAVACPYSHRVELVLAAKGLAADFVEIDLLDRPAWFMERESGGKIPLIEVDGTAVPFGDRVNEYLDERFPVPALNPGTPEQRAEVRTWVDWCTDTLGPTYEAALMNVDGSQQAKLLRKVEKVVADLEERLVARRNSGPYWHGASAGLVDYTYATILLRFEGLSRFHGWSIPAECERLIAWRATLLSDPLVGEASDAEAIA